MTAQKERATAGTVTLNPSRPGRRSNINPTEMELTMQPNITPAASPPLNVAASDGLDLIWGCKGIAAAIGRTERATYGMLEAGELPARQIGQRWVASRRQLMEHFGIGNGDYRSQSAEAVQ